MFEEEKCIGTSFQFVGKLNNKRKLFHFICENVLCDNVVKITKSDFKHRKTGLCRKCSNNIKLAYSRANFISSKLRPYEALYNSFKKNCKEKDIFVNLTFEDFLDYTSINSCAYCNSHISWTQYNMTVNGYRYNLDRKDCKEGYFKSNLVVCCWRCNDLKSNKFSHFEFLLIGEALKIIDRQRSITSDE